MLECFKSKGDWLMEEVIKKGYNFPCAISGADEVAVKLFLDGKIKFTDIVNCLEYAVNKTQKLDVTFESLEYTDKQARAYAMEFYKNRCKI